MTNWIKAVFCILCLLTTGAGVARAGNYIWPADEVSQEAIPNRFIVELRVQYGDSWYRLDTGPRPEHEARVLYDGLHQDLANRPHKLVLINLDDGENTGHVRRDDLALLDCGVQAVT